MRVAAPCAIQAIPGRRDVILVSIERRGGLRIVVGRTILLHQTLDTVHTIKKRPMNLSLVSVVYAMLYTVFCCLITIIFIFYFYLFIKLTMTSMYIRLNRVDHVYREGESVAGVVVVETPSSISHNGLVLRSSGLVHPLRNAKKAGMSYVPLHSEQVDLTPSGKIPSGTTEIPFEYELTPLEDSQLYETYHGVNLAIRYELTAELTRGGLRKNIVARDEINVQVPVPEGRAPPEKPQEFVVEPKDLENVKEDKKDIIPKFRVTGKLYNINASLNQPFLGHLRLEQSEATVRSIDVQLIRVESAFNYTESTEVQNLQIADGHPAHNMQLPIYMILPRLFTCPSVEANDFSVRFEVNITVSFYDQYKIAENVPIDLSRH
eukprot:gb/GECG01005821.1/.p1 GENE.gb/GECG01005821.1/~~gb/GECG01005821.1/.p1  ORF type:complete len:377 (+),score=27.75 gb/GECG01005821.1/:1-1131(+)